MGKKRKKRDFDLIPPPNKNRNKIRKSDNLVPFLPLPNIPDDPGDLDDIDEIYDDLEPFMRLEGGSHRRVDPSPDEIWGPGGLACEAREYFAEKKSERRGESAGKKISKTDRDREIMERLLDPLGYFGPIKIDADVDDDID